MLIQNSTTTAPAPTDGGSGFNKTIADDFRANHGHASAGPFVDSDLLLLTTRGAKTGQSRTTPLVYTRDGERYVIIASKGGAPKDPAWLGNLVANPLVTLEVAGEQFPARAKVASPEIERRRLYDAQAARYGGFAEYERKTERVIPVVTLTRAG